MQDQRDSSLPDLTQIVDQGVFCFQPDHKDLVGVAPADEAVAVRSAVVIPFRPRIETVSPAAAEGRR